MLHHNVDYTPYEGIELNAWPLTVISRGQIIVENGNLIANKNHGIFLKSDLPETAKTLDKNNLLSRLEKNTFKE